jgi:hypothetical protein
MATTVTTARSLRPKNGLTIIHDILEYLQPEPDALLVVTRAYIDRYARRHATSVYGVLDEAWMNRQRQWQRRIGHLLTANEVARMSTTMKTRAAIHKAHAAKRLLAVKIGSRVFFPQFQFGEDGSAMPWVRELVAALPDSDTRLQFIAAGRIAFNGQSYAAMLQTHPKDALLIAKMLKAARKQAAAEAR